MLYEPIILSKKFRIMSYSRLSRKQNIIIIIISGASARIPFWLRPVKLGKKIEIQEWNIRVHFVIFENAAI